MFTIRPRADDQQWVLGLIQGAYCFSATGMLPAMAEEAKSPDTTIPRAM
jgi:amino acid permease